MKIYIFTGVALLSHPLLDKEKEKLKELSDEAKSHEESENTKSVAAKRRPPKITARHANDDSLPKSNPGLSSTQVNIIL